METAEAAVRREVREELGVDLPIDRLAFVHENFFDGSSGLAGRQCHELTFYYLMRFDPSLEIASTSRTGAGLPEWFEWIELASYGAGQVAYPTFFAAELGSLGPEPKWITTRE